MTQGERVKAIRKAKEMTMEKFGKRLGVTRTAISNIESGNRGVTEQMLTSICREFNVNEDWLRNGVGEMFIDPATFSLDEYAQANKLTKTEISIIRGFMELDPATRQAIYNIFANAFNEINAAIPDDPPALEKLYPPIDENSDVG